METNDKLIEPNTDAPEETTLMKTEIINAERMWQEVRDNQSTTSYEAAPKMTSYISFPQRQEEQIELPGQNKHESELILEPEKNPDSAITDAETLTDSAEPSTGEFGKMRNITLDPNKCFICDKVFKTTDDVQIHLSEHGNMIPYQCSACTIETGQEMKITSLQQLHSHFRMHIRPIKCPNCPYRTSTRWALLRHIRNYHKQSDQAKHICEQCGKKFLKERALNMHVLAKHQQVHTGVKPFQCEQCVKSFLEKRFLLKHVSKQHRSP